MEEQQEFQEFNGEEEKDQNEEVDLVEKKNQ